MNDLAQALEGTTIHHHPDAILEAVQLRKMFPLRSLNLFGAKQVVHAVEDTSLALYPGRATALVGESGSGKTTVARMLARLYTPTAGSMLFAGRSVAGAGRLALREYRRQGPLVFQDPFSSLNPVHDVLYHLSRPLNRSGHARRAAQVMDQVLTLLAPVG